MRERVFHEFGRIIMNLGTSLIPRMIVKSFGDRDAEIIRMDARVKDYSRIMAKKHGTRMSLLMCVSRE